MPVQPLALVEHELEAGDEHRQRQEAGPVQVRGAGPAAVLDVDDHAGQRRQPERHDHEEDPAPVVHLREDAADGRRQHRPDDHSHAEDRHGGGLLLARVAVHHDRLAERHQRRPEGALQDPEQHQALERGGETAGQRRAREADHPPDQDGTPREARRQPARHRRRDRGGDDVEGDDQRDLVGGRRQRSLHLRQRYVRDGNRHRVQHRDHGQGGQDHRPRERGRTGGGGVVGCGDRHGGDDNAAGPAAHAKSIASRLPQTPERRAPLPEKRPPPAPSSSIAIPALSEGLDQSASRENFYPAAMNKSLTGPIYAD